MSGIFQPIVSTTPTPVGVSQPNDSFAGAQAIGQGLSGLVQLGTSIYKSLETEGGGVDRYAKSIRDAAESRSAGNDAKSREIIRTANVQAMRDGLDQDDMATIQTSFGFIMDRSAMDPEQYYIESLRGHNGGATWTGARAQASMELGRQASVDEVEQRTLQIVEQTLGNLSTLELNKGNAAVLAPAVEQLLNTGIAETQAFATMYLENNLVPSREDINALYAHLNNLESELKTTEGWADMDASLQGKLLSRVSETRANIEQLEGLFSVESLGNEVKLNLLKSLQEFRANNPDTEIAQKINALVPIITGSGDSPLVEVLLAAGYDMSEFKTVLSNIDYFGDIRFDITDPENPAMKELRDKIASEAPANLMRIVESSSTYFKTLDARRAAMSTIGLNGIAERFFAVSETLKRAYSEGEFIEADRISKMLSDDMIRVWEEVEQVNPEAAHAMLKNIREVYGNYQATIKERLDSMEFQSGVSFVDGGIEVNEEVFLSNIRMSDEDKAKLPMVLETVGYRGGWAELIEDGGTKLRAWINSPINEQGIGFEQAREVMGIASKLANSFTLTDAMRVAVDPENRGMINSGLRLAERYTKLAGQFGNFEPISPEQFAQVDQIGGLVSSLWSVNSLAGPVDKYEASGDYNMMFSGAQNGRYSERPPITSWTLDEWIAFQGGEYKYWVQSELNKNGGNHKPSSPLGRYQIVGKTLKGLKEIHEFDGNMIMNPANQNMLFHKLIEGRVKMAGGDIDKLMIGLTEEWDGLKNMLKTEEGKARLRQIAEMLINDF